MPGIKTSAITYRRGISNSTPNFFLVAQANYVIPQPTSRFRENNVTSIAPTPPTPPTPTTPGAPTITSITPGNQSLTLNFTAPTSDGGSSITNYQYSIDGGTNYTSAGTTSSPITITGLTNGTTYPLRIRAVNSIGSGAESNVENGTPVSPPTPTTFTFNTAPLQSTSSDSTLTQTSYGSRTSELISVTIGTSCTSIAANCFLNCEFITGTITIPNTVTSLGSQSFLNCQNITGTITIPNTVTTIGSFCFGGCQGINQIYFEPGSQITSLPFYCFGGCANLASINIPSTVTSIGPSCFLNATLSSITIPGSVATLGTSCFSGCGFTTVIIPSSVISIGATSFANCSNLTSLTFNNPNNISTNIVAMLDRITPLGTTTVTFINTANYASLNGNVTNYFTATPPSPVSSYVFIPDSPLVTTFIFNSGLPITTTDSIISKATYLLGDGRTEANLIRVYIGTSCTDISDNCFNLFNAAPNQNLQSVTFLGNSVTTIGNYSFANNGGASSFSTITIPGSVTSLGENCFLYCEKLNGTITIPNSVTSLGQSCFSGCQILDRIIFQSGSQITSLSTACFAACPQLSTINIPASVTTVGAYCFQSCSSLTSASITFDGTLVTTFNGSCFAYCTGLNSANFIPNTVTYLGPNCFFGCTGFTTIRIPSSVGIISYGLMEGCTNLSLVQFTDQSSLSLIDNMLLNLNQNITITFYNVSPPQYSSLSTFTKLYFIDPPPSNWTYSYSSGPPPP